MNKITDYLFYLPSCESPISSESFIIFQNNETYVFDVGAIKDNVNELNKIKNKTIILSHFHEDHCLNLKELSYDKLYVSNFTYKHVHDGIILQEDLKINDQLEILSIPSCHCKGSLAFNINHEYCLLGDAIYPSVTGYNHSLLKETILKLTSIDTKYFVISHHPKLIFNKETILKFLNQKYLGNSNVNVENL